MKVEKNKMVSLTYRLTENDEQGSLIEETGEEGPLVFLFGVDNLIPGFESNILNLQTGDTFSFSVAAADAYGEFDENGLAELPVDMFFRDGKLDTELCEVGNIIPMRNESGQVLNGMIKEIKDTDVIMDFNHPLAGKNLHFTGKIIGIRNPSEEEIIQRNSHGHHDHGDSCCCGG